MMAGSIARDEWSDYDSSCSSSITVPDSTRSWMSNLSFGSRRRSSSSAADGGVEMMTTTTTTATLPVVKLTMKPHKANEVGWEAMRWLRGVKGEVGLEHFRLLRRVGSGDIGNVYLCEIRNPMVGLPKCFYAMKVVDREAVCVRNKERRADMEKEILKVLDHPFLPTLYAHFEASHYSCLLMEFCPGGDLYAARQRQPNKRFSISSAKFYAAEIILALEYLHMMGIIYRDLKPENVLVREDGHIMLSDFDLCLKWDVVPKLIRCRTTASDATTERHVRSYSTSTTSCAAAPIQPVLSCFSIARRKKSTTVTTITEHAAAPSAVYGGDSDGEGEEFDPEPELIAEPINARSKSFVGTHEYLAPEVISGQGHGSGVDWWTLGIFLYEMLYGKTPFKGENNEKTLMNILKQPLRFPRIGFSSSKEYEEMVKVEDLIKKLLVKNPKKRIGSLKGSVEIKRHDFFKGLNWALIRSVRPPQIPNNNLNYSKYPSNYLPKLSKKQRQQPYQIPNHHFDYF